MDPLFERRELHRNVHINSKFLQKNMLHAILTQLRMNLEGHCSSEGYIQPQSITILKYSVGRSNYTRGGVDYNVTFQADVCFPHQGQVFKATTNLRSKIGIHASTPPLKVLIPRDLHIGNQEFETIEMDKEIEFEVANATFKQMDKDIIVIGRLRSEIKAAPLMPLLHADSDISIPQKLDLGTASDEKLVTIVPQGPAPEKKKRLKRKNVDTPNEPTEVRINEDTN